MIRTLQIIGGVIAVLFAISVMVAAFSMLTPEVQVALIGSWERAWVALVSNAASVSAAIVATGGAILTWWNGRKTTKGIDAAEKARSAAVEARTVLEQKIDQNTQLTEDVKETAVRSHHEVTQAFMAGKREGFVGGIAEGKKQATGPAPLSGK